MGVRQGLRARDRPGGGLAGLTQGGEPAVAYYDPDLLARYTPEQIDAARAREAKGKRVQVQLQKRAAESERQEREALKRTETYDVRVSRELKDRLDDLVAEAYPDLRSTRGLLAGLLREILRDALGMDPKDVGVHRRLLELRGRRANGADEKQRGESEQENEHSPSNSPRLSKRLRFRCSADLRNTLKSAAAATEPESSMKKSCSSARLEREVLLNECGLRSEDGGQTLKRLSEWLPQRHYREATAVSREDMEREVALEAARCLNKHNRELWVELASPELTDDSDFCRLLSYYTRLTAAHAMPLYDLKVDRYRRHLPEAKAQQAAKQAVIEAGVLLPPLWKAVSPDDSVVGEPRDPDLFREFAKRAAKNLIFTPELYLALRLTPVLEAGPGDEAVPLLAVYQLVMARGAEEVYWGTIERLKNRSGIILPGGPSPEERAKEAATERLRVPDRWEPAADLLRSVSPTEADPPPVVVELIWDREYQVVVRGGSGAPAFFKPSGPDDSEQAEEGAECEIQKAQKEHERRLAAFRNGLEAEAEWSPTARAFRNLRDW